MPASCFSPVALHRLAIANSSAMQPPALAWQQAQWKATRSRRATRSHCVSCIRECLSSRGCQHDACCRDERSEAWPRAAAQAANRTLRAMLDGGEAGAAALAADLQATRRELLDEEEVAGARFLAVLQVCACRLGLWSGLKLEVRFRVAQGQVRPLLGIRQGEGRGGFGLDAVAAFTEHRSSPQQGSAGGHVCDPGPAKLCARRAADQLCEAVIRGGLLV